MNIASPIPESKNFLRNDIKSQRFFRINSKKIIQQKVMNLLPKNGKHPEFSIYWSKTFLFKNPPIFSGYEL